MRKPWLPRRPARWLRRGFLLMGLLLVPAFVAAVLGPVLLARPFTLAQAIVLVVGGIVAGSLLWFACGWLILCAYCRRRRPFRTAGV